MGCSSCSTDGKAGGCKNNGSCGTSGCNKLNVYNWLSHMELPEGQEPYTIVEVRFKGSRKEFYKNKAFFESNPKMLRTFLGVWEKNKGNMFSPRPQNRFLAFLDSSQKINNSYGKKKVERKFRSAWGERCNSRIWVAQPVVVVP